MVTRLISTDVSELLGYNKEELKQSIKACEGRVILSENVCGRHNFVGDITSSELAAAYGADMILLNGIDLFDPYVAGLADDEQADFVNAIHKYVGRLVGANLEPLDPNAEMSETRIEISQGRTASLETFQKANELGLDFICLTGNPGVGVTNQTIVEAVKLAKQHFNGLIIAGKMHSAGVTESVISPQITADLIEAGADVIMVPAVGTVPAVRDSMIYETVDFAHQHGALVMSAIGTSQEGADKETIRRIAYNAKVAGVDIQHIGDAGYGGLAPVENIYEMSLVIRGIRHTASRIGRSINR